MFVRLGVSALMMVGCAGLIGVYGSAKYNEGLAACHSKLSKAHQKQEDELASLYQDAIKVKATRMQEALRIENLINRMDDPEHDEIKKIAAASPCDHLGSGVIELLNQFAFAQTPQSIAAAHGKDARGK